MCHYLKLFHLSLGRPLPSCVRIGRDISLIRKEFPYILDLHHCSHILLGCLPSLLMPRTVTFLTLTDGSQMHGPPTVAVS